MSICRGCASELKASRDAIYKAANVPQNLFR